MGALLPRCTHARYLYEHRRRRRCRCPRLARSSRARRAGSAVCRQSSRGRARALRTPRDLDGGRRGRPRCGFLGRRGRRGRGRVRRARRRSLSRSQCGAAAGCAPASPGRLQARRGGRARGGCVERRAARQDALRACQEGVGHTCAAIAVVRSRDCVRNGAARSLAL